jgi:hypothetical protein
MKRISLLTAPAVLFAASPAFAVEKASTVGGALSGVLADIWNPLLLLTVMCAGLGGLYLLIRGVFKFIETAQRGSGSGYGSALAHIALAAFLIALPQASGMGMNTIFGEARGGSTMMSGGLDYDDNGTTGNYLSSLMGGAAEVGAVDNCMSDATPAVCMSKNIAKNVIPMAVVMLFAFSFLGGLAIAGTTIVQWAKSTDRSEQSKSNILKIVTAILLMNASVLFRLGTTTVMGQDTPISDLGHLTANSPLLSYPVNSSIEVVKQYSQLIGNCFTILVFFGAWAFVRGIFLIKSVAEGRGPQGASYGMAATYIIAGILMANAKFSTCLILATVGGADMGTGFCN